MRVLLDEDVPGQVTDILTHLLPGHSVAHVHGIRWSGKKDLFLFRDATGRFDAILTNNYKQFEDPDETARIKKSGLHHVSYGQKARGLKGLALAIGAIVASTPSIVEDLAVADGQRLVTISDLDPSRRYRLIDPRRDPPKYWPR
jgi:PIN like domain